MRLISTIFCLLFISLSASAQNEWFSGHTQFDFSTCQEKHAKYAKTHNSLGYYAEETKALRFLVDECTLNMNKMFMQKFIQFNGESKYSTNGSIGGISVVNENVLQSIYDDFLKNPYYPHEIIETQSCFTRANYMSLYLTAHGIRTGQVVASEGDFNVEGKISKRNVHWDTHTALYVYNLKKERVIIDPSLSDGPMIVSAWTGKMTQRSAKKTFKLAFGMSSILTHLADKKPRIDELIGHATGGMVRDMFHLLDNADPLPERITPEHLPVLMEATESYYRKKPKVQIP